MKQHQKPEFQDYSRCIFDELVIPDDARCDCDDCHQAREDDEWNKDMKSEFGAS